MKRLLIVVDFQNDFVNGSLGFDGASKLEKPIIKKIEEYKSLNYDIIFTLDTHDEDYLNTREGQKLPIKHCLEGSKGFNLFGDVSKHFDKKSVYFKKRSFGSLNLANYLKSKNYEKVEFVGLVSNICVISNVVLVQAALPEAEIIVDASCTASHDLKLHDKALDVMEGLHIKVVNRKENHA